MSTSKTALHVGTATAATHVKEEESRVIEDDIQAFLARGGKIEVVGVTPIRNGYKAKRKRGMALAGKERRFKNETPEPA